MIWEYFQIFFIGVLEDFLSSFNTKTIQRNNQLFSFLVSFVSVILWYYVFVLVVDNIHKFLLIVVYATGGGLGDIVTIRFDKQIHKFEILTSKLINMCLFKKRKKDKRLQVSFSRILKRKIMKAVARILFKKRRYRKKRKLRR